MSIRGGGYAGSLLQEGLAKLWKYDNDEVPLGRYPTFATMNTSTREHTRLHEEAGRKVNWKRWGPYLPDRQWATVREDYTENGTAWGGFPHDHARSRAYRWGEDGLFGICDRQCRLRFSPRTKPITSGFTAWRTRHRM